MEDNDIMIAAEPAAAMFSESVGRIALTKQMRDAVIKAERELEEGKCLSESDFKAHFAKWL